MRRSWFVSVLAVSALCAGCGSGSRVVVYTALDQMYSEPILQEFQRRSGIRVQAAYDTEAQKTVGLYSRIVAERDAPQCDVFWNNEIVHTILLQRQGLLEPYESPSAVDIPAQFRSPEHYWTGFAARGRIMIYNTNAVQDPVVRPTSIFALAMPRWRGKGTLANPLFGTTGTHVAALFARLGPEEAKRRLLEIRDNETVISAGNATVRDRVAAGELAIGLTDTDDAHAALLDGKPVGIEFPDSQQLGTLMIPNSVAVIAGAPHPQAARKLVDYLLTPEVEEALARCRSAQIPVRPELVRPALLQPLMVGMKVMEVDFEEVADQMEAARQFVEQEFLAGTQ